MKFEPLHASMGASVTEIDCANSSEALAEELQAALTQWQVLLFRGQNLTDEQYREQALFLGTGTTVLDSGGPNTGFQGWGAPRTYALEVRYSM